MRLPVYNKHYQEKRYSQAWNAGFTSEESIDKTSDYGATFPM